VEFSDMAKNRSQLEEMAEKEALAGGEAERYLQEKNKS